MTRYIFEVVLNPDEEGGYFVTVPDLPGCVTEGDSIEEALLMATDALMTVVGSMIKHGDAIPSPTFGAVAPTGGKVIALSFVTDASYIVDTVSPAEAAVMLGVSRGRVSQMTRKGILDGYKIGTETRVSLESINARLATPRNAGRPRKVELAGTPH
jgi:excisionase family DNA binding protein